MTRVLMMVGAMVLGSAVCFADPTCTGTAHTVHTVSTNKPATCVLSKLYESASLCVSDGQGNAIDSVPLAVTPTTPLNFDMIVIGDNADFNMEYALTCVVNDGAEAKSPKVIFTIGADGPALPDIVVVNLYGAQGTWKSTGNGEAYTLIF